MKDEMESEAVPPEVRRELDLIAEELIRRIPALRALDTLAASAISVSRSGSEIKFCLPDLIPLETLEQAYVVHVLERVNGNKSHAAQALGVDPSTLYRKLSRWGL